MLLSNYIFISENTYINLMHTTFFSRMWTIFQLRNKFSPKTRSNYHCKCSLSDKHGLRTSEMRESSVSRFSDTRIFLGRHFRPRYSVGRVSFISSHPALFGDLWIVLFRRWLTMLSNGGSALILVFDSFDVSWFKAFR